MKNAVLAGALAAMVAGSALPAYAETGASDKTEMQAALGEAVKATAAAENENDGSGTVDDSQEGEYDE